MTIEVLREKEYLKRQLDITEQQQMIFYKEIEINLKEINETLKQLLNVIKTK